MKQFVFIFCFTLFLSVALGFAQDRPMKIIEMPKPELPADYGTLCVQGTIRLKIEFLEDGSIGKIFPITSIPVRNLTGLAIDAARQIRFEPAQRNAFPKTVTKNIDYFYGLSSSGWKVKTSPGSESLTRLTVDGQANAIIQKAVQLLGGDRYKNVTTQVGRGNFSLLKSGVNVSVQTFVDVIVFPDKERTEFKAAGVKTVQTNSGATGWVFDGDQELIKVQNERQVANFKRGLRTSLDNLLRGYWKGQAELSYIGRRPGTLGKRNDAIKLTYNDGFIVEFEFTADEGMPVRAIYKTVGGDGEAVIEEDRYAQFIDTQGITAPYIIDRFTNGEHISRINFLIVEYNKPIPDSIFAKPTDSKQLKKDLKF